MHLKMNEDKRLAYLTRHQLTFFQFAILLIWENRLSLAAFVKTKAALLEKEPNWAAAEPHFWVRIEYKKRSAALVALQCSDKKVVRAWENILKRRFIRCDNNNNSKKNSCHHSGSSTTKCCSIAVAVWHVSLGTLHGIRYWSSKNKIYSVWKSLNKSHWTILPVEPTTFIFKVWKGIWIFPPKTTQSYWWLRYFWWFSNTIWKL